MNRFLGAFHRDKRKPETQMSKLIKKASFYGVLGLFLMQYLTKHYKVNLVFGFERNEQNIETIEENKVLEKGVYEPTFFMPNSYMQRVYAKYFEDEQYIKPDVEQADREAYEINWIPIHNQSKDKPNIPIAIIITGSEGIDNCVKSLVLSSYKSGFRSVCIKVDDVHDINRLKATLQKIKQKVEKSSRVYGIGVEYGANLMINYAARYPEKNRDSDSFFNGLVSIGNPLDIAMSERKIERANWLWKRLLYNDVLQGRVEGFLKYASLKTNVSNSEVQKLREEKSLFSLDRHFLSLKGSGENEASTASPLKDVDYEIYKQRNSSINQIKHLNVPLLMIQSQEDPFCIEISEQVQEKIDNSRCIVVETPQGGHLEWFQTYHKLRWVKRPIIEFMKHLEQKAAHSVV